MEGKNLDIPRWIDSPPRTGTVLCCSLGRPGNFYGADVMQMTDFPIVDGVILVIIAAFFLRSFFHGALNEIFSLLSIVTGYLAAGKYGGLVQEWMVGWTGESRWFAFAGYIGLFFAVWFLIGIAGKMVSSFVRNSIFGSWDRIGGGFIGLVKGTLIVSAAVVLLDAYLPSVAPPKGENSQVMPYVRQIGTYVRKAATWDLKEKVEEIKKSMGEGEKSSGGAERK